MILSSHMLATMAAAEYLGEFPEWMLWHLQARLIDYRGQLGLLDI